MGVQGLTNFLNQNDMFHDYQLCNTVVIIDGFNLIYSHYFINQQKLNDHMFGGDYPDLANNVRYLFRGFKKCNISPIVIFDGAIDPSKEKLKTMVKRAEESLNTAHKIYSYNTFNEGILPLFADQVYCQQLTDLEVPIYQTCFEADDTIIKIAFDLKCPIISNDGDFLLYNLPGGIVQLKSLFNTDSPVRKKDNKNFIQCRYYRVENLKRIYPSLNLDLVQIIGFILGNDYVDLELNKKLLKRITQYEERLKMIYHVFLWISKHNSLHSLLNHLTRLSNDSTSLIQIIQKHYLNLKSDHIQPESYENYFQNNWEQLFLLNVKVPSWMKRLLIERKIKSRVLSISQSHIDWCRPLVEDFLFPKSSYDTSIEICRYIYGILRVHDVNIANIKKYSRIQKIFKQNKVKPEIILNDKYLPKLNDIDNMSIKNRKKLFFKILNIDGEIMDKIHHLFSDEMKKINQKFNYKLTIPFVSMLIGLIYMINEFSDHIWIEFVYAIYMNLWFTGYLCLDNRPKFLLLDKNFDEIILNHLSQFSALPKLSNCKVYMPRVIHFYNVYQTCLYNIEFLSEILKLKTEQFFYLDEMIIALKGTFIYNLTCELSSREKPFLYLQHLFERQQFRCRDLFIKLINLIMKNCRRDFLAKKLNIINNEDIICQSLRERLRTTETSTFNVVPSGPAKTGHTTNQSRYFIRAFDYTNKRTHIQSQKMKLK